MPALRHYTVQGTESCTGADSTTNSVWRDPPPEQHLCCVLVNEIKNMGQPVYVQHGAQEMGAEMTKEEMQQLILIMGTITVISFILVITLSSIIIVFIWYVFAGYSIFVLLSHSLLCFH